MSADFIEVNDTLPPAEDPFWNPVQTSPNPEDLLISQVISALLQRHELLGGQEVGKNFEEKSDELLARILNHHPHLQLDEAEKILSENFLYAWRHPNFASSFGSFCPHFQRPRSTPPSSPTPLPNASLPRASRERSSTMPSYLDLELCSARTWRPQPQSNGPPARSRRPEFQSRWEELRRETERRAEAQRREDERRAQQIEEERIRTIQRRREEVQERERERQRIERERREHEEMERQRIERERREREERERQRIERERREEEEMSQEEADIQRAIAESLQDVNRQQEERFRTLERIEQQRREQAEERERERARIERERNEEEERERERTRIVQERNEEERNRERIEREMREEERARIEEQEQNEREEMERANMRVRFEDEINRSRRNIPLHGMGPRQEESGSFRPRTTSPYASARRNPNATLDNILPNSPRIPSDFARSRPPVRPNSTRPIGNLNNGYAPSNPAPTRNPSLFPSSVNHPATAPPYPTDPTDSIPRFQNGPGASYPRHQSSSNPRPDFSNDPPSPPDDMIFSSPRPRSPRPYVRSSPHPPPDFSGIREPNNPANLFHPPNGSGGRAGAGPGFNGVPNGTGVGLNGFPNRNVRGGGSNGPPNGSVGGGGLNGSPSVGAGTSSNRYPGIPSPASMIYRPIWRLDEAEVNAAPLEPDGAIWWSPGPCRFQDEHIQASVTSQGPYSDILSRSRMESSAKTQLSLWNWIKALYQQETQGFPSRMNPLFSNHLRQINLDYPLPAIRVQSRIRLEGLGQNVGQVYWLDGGAWKDLSMANCPMKGLNDESVTDPSQAKTLWVSSSGAVSPGNNGPARGEWEPWLVVRALLYP